MFRCSVWPPLLVCFCESACAPSTCFVCPCRLLSFLYFVYARLSLALCVMLFAQPLLRALCFLLLAPLSRSLSLLSFVCLLLCFDCLGLSPFPIVVRSIVFAPSLLFSSWGAFCCLAALLR